MRNPALNPYFQRLRRLYAERHYGAPKRRPGARPGNQNARKRGIVDRPLTPQQRNALRAVRRAGLLSDECSSLRVRTAAVLTDPRAEPEVLLRAVRLLARMLRIELKERDARRRMG